MAKRKKNTIELEHIPVLLQKAIAVIDREINVLSDKSSLSDSESKSLISYCQTLSSIYKDYRQEVIETEKKLKEMSKEDIAKLIKAEAN